MFLQHRAVKARGFRDRTSRRALGLGTTGILIAAALAVAAPIDAASSNATQTTTLNVTGGVLTVSLSQQADAFPSVSAGGGTVSAPAGSINFTNTLNDGLGWSITVAATDMVTTSGPSCAPASGCIPFTSEAFGSGCASTGFSQVSSGVSGTNQTSFAGPDTTPGQTFSSPVTIGTSQPVLQGSFSITGCIVHATVAANQSAGSYGGSLQYTITG